jgi:hypothetical protein
LQLGFGKGKVVCVLEAVAIISRRYRGWGSVAPGQACPSEGEGEGAKGMVLFSDIHELGEAIHIIFQNLLASKVASHHSFHDGVFRRCTTQTIHVFVSNGKGGWKNSGGEDEVRQRRCVCAMEAGCGTRCTPPCAVDSHQYWVCVGREKECPN